MEKSQPQEPHIIEPIETITLNLENLGLLIKDPNNPGKFDSVFVDKIRERQAIILAESSKKPAMTLLNSILGCVFKDEELAGSSGLGLRKSGDDKKPPLNKLNVDAVRGYITRYCKIKSVGITLRHRLQ
uniref:BEN domain-containing protein n=1 Tax=Magallana gigas TaxID=29159 RepID=A0A8W8MD62_MAGGI